MEKNIQLPRSRHGGTNPIALTERDRMLLVALTRRVKVLTVKQVHATWWSSAEFATALRRLRLLSTSGWLRRLSVLTRDIDFWPTEPLLLWMPADAEPDWQVLCRQTRARWQVPLRSVQVVVATRQASNHFGGQARYPRPSEVTHDLYLAGVFLRRLTHRLDEAEAWRGEGQTMIERAGDPGIVPDAIIAHNDRTRAIEVVGESYTTTKLKMFHRYCKLKNWSYELW